jgi:DNA helicase II / ATP-dependent DNA helicase PcrA
MSASARPQRAASYTGGPLLIVAGPGSGKTRVITHRIAHLVADLGVAPWRILAVTFTNKAAREMRERVDALLGRRSDDLTLGTFHSVCARILRIEGGAIGLERSFAIYDDDDQMNLMKRVVADLGLDAKRVSPRAVLSTISRAKNELVDPETYGRAVSDYFQEIVARCYRRYQELLSSSSSW